MRWKKTGRTQTGCGEAAGKAAQVSNAAVSKKALEQGTVATDLGNLKATFTAVTGNKVDTNNGVAFLAWQNEFNRRVVDEVGLTGKPVPPQRRAEIINNMALSRVKLRKPVLPNVERSAFNLDQDDINRLAATLGVKEELRPVFAVAYPNILTSIRFQKLPTTNESIKGEYTKMISAAESLAPAARQEFVVNYANITKKLLGDKYALTPNNYLGAWQQMTSGGN